MATSTSIPGPVPYFAIRDQLRTGDVLTFRGTAAVDIAIDLLTDGTYSHTGLVLRPGADQLWFWDAPGIPDKLPDPLRGNGPSPGARAASLDALLAEYLPEMKLTTFTWRRLQPALTATQIQAFQTFATSVDGTLFPGTRANIPPQIQALLTKLIGSELLADINVGLLISYLNGTVLQTAEPGSFFCAQLAAETFMQLGILPSSPWPSNSYAPSNFDDEPTPLQLLSPFSLSAPVLVTWTPPDSAV